MLALVTGASSGIGLQYATALARDYHTDLLLVSNQEAELQQVAADLHQQYGVATTWLCRDLSLIDAAESLHAYCQEQHIEVDILINNAGVFFFNELIETSMRRVELMLMLHMVTLTKMTKLFGEDMVRRNQGKPKAECRKGYILNMSSMSAWMAMPGIQCYNSTKSFINNFSHSVWYEYMPHGVSVTSVTPGAVDTGLYGLSMPLRRLAVAIHVSIPPEKLVQKALRAMFRQKKWCMPGLINHLAVPFLKHLPDWLVFFVIGKISKFMK